MEILIIYGFFLVFIAVVAFFSIIKYKKMKRNKSVGIHSKLYKEKFDLNHKVNNYNIGYHIYIDDEKKKWAIVSDNPKYCDIYFYSSLSDYALTINGETTVRSSMKSVIGEFTDKKSHNITLDIFTKIKNYRIVFLNHEEKTKDNSFLVPLGFANEFCDLLDQIINHS